MVSVKKLVYEEIMGGFLGLRRLDGLCVYSTGYCSAIVWCVKPAFALQAL